MLAYDCIKIQHYCRRRQEALAWRCYCFFVKAFPDAPKSHLNKMTCNGSCLANACISCGPISFLDQMAKLFVLLLFFSYSLSIIAQSQFNVDAEKRSVGYLKVKDSLVRKYRYSKPGKFGEFVKGVDEDVVTSQKLLALTFDACGGKGGNGYDKDLINYLHKEGIPASLFISGLWIDEHRELFQQLSKDTLFEIENHGLHHRPCSVSKERPYGIEATDSIGAAIDEMELNARKILFYTGRRPLFFRSATAETDEACAKVAQALGMKIIGYQILSGDVGGTKKEIVKQNILTHLTKGAVVIGHFNHPEWNTYEALRITIPALRKMGYKFVKLQHHSLKGR
jgi:peptidoglycan/xylan/chitin deacetylase (PgdA/CDA1 family)